MNTPEITAPAQRTPLTAQQIRDQAAFYYRDESGYRVTVGLYSNAAVATFRKFSDCRDYVEKHNAALSR